MGQPYQAHPVSVLGENVKLGNMLDASFTIMEIVMPNCAVQILGKALTRTALVCALGVFAGKACAWGAWVEPPPEKSDVKAEEPKGVGLDPNRNTLVELSPKMPDWTVMVEVSLYRVGASGKVRMPSSGGLASPPGQSSLKLEEIGADAAEWAPYGRLRWRPNKGKWSIGLSSFGTKIDETGTANEDQRVGDMLLLKDDAIATNITFIEADIEAGYRIFENPCGVTETCNPRIAPYVDLIGGVRIIDTDVEFRQTPASVVLPAPGQQFEVSNHDAFFQPMVGARAGLELLQKFNIDMKATVGALPGNNRSFTWDIEPCFTWRPHENFGVHIGYRNMFMNLRSGKDDSRYSWRGTMAGLYLGVTGRF